MNSTLTPIENHILKAFNMINREFTKDKAYYSEALKQLTRMADVSEQITELIRNRINVNGNRSEIKISQFEEIKADTTLSKLSEIAELLKGIYTCVTQKTICDQIQEDTTEPMEHESETIQNTVPNETKEEDCSENTDEFNSGNYTTPAESKRILHLYATQLHNATLRKSGNHVLDSIVVIIHKWFKSRFLTKVNGKIPVRFHLSQFPNLIYSIVMYFGYHLELGDFEESLVSFEKWIDEVCCNSEITDQYLLPWEIWEVYKEASVDYASVSAALIWYKLAKHKYRKLIETKIENCENYIITFEGLFDKISGMDDPLLDIFGEIKDNPDCFERYGIV